MQIIDNKRNYKNSLEKIIQDAIDMLKYGFIYNRKDKREGNVSGESLDDIVDKVKNCNRCALHSMRTHAVPGEGVKNPIVMVVGEAPGAMEDKKGLPFVGPAGEYLDTWLAAISLYRTKNIFITNVVKCRPKNNRDPMPHEYEACNMFLMRQVEILAPTCILAVGRIAGRILCEKDETTTLASMRGTMYKYLHIPIFVTYHPSAVLRRNTLRKYVWEDLKRMQRYLRDHEPKYTK